MRQKIIAWSFIAFYSLFTLYQFLFNDIKLFDYVIYICLLVVLLFFIKKVTIPSTAVLLFGLAPIFHTVGTIPFLLNGQETSFYTDSFLGGNYDLLTHFMGFLMIALAVLQIYYANVAKKISSVVLFLLFFALIGVGTCIELAEFTGYRLFGFGLGAFQFGDGDNSMNFGPWGDSMTDTYANVLGIIVAFILFFRYKYRKPV